MLMESTCQKKFTRLTRVSPPPPNYIALLSETAFKTDFGPRKVSNQKVKVQVFWFRALPVVQNHLRKQFRSKVLYN